MLKRYQVMLTDWQEEYIKFLAERHDLNFSEIIRLMLCLETMLVTKLLYPEYKISFPLKEILSKADEIVSQKKRNKEGARLILSKFYFEARKATEYRLSKEKRKKK